MLQKNFYSFTVITKSDKLASNFQLIVRYPGVFTCTKMRKIIETKAYRKCTDAQRRIIGKHLSHDPSTVDQSYVAANTCQQAALARQLISQIAYTDD